jgi:DNA-binding response OmpR family regulator
MDNSRDVMIVEDDECTRSLLAALVTYYGFRPEPVSDGRAALARLKGATSGLVVLDLFLPDTNGFEVLRELKSRNQGCFGERSYSPPRLHGRPQGAWN